MGWATLLLVLAFGEDARPAAAPEGGALSAEAAESSPLEELYRARAGQELRQFGYDAFGATAIRSPQPGTALGAVDDDYRLGIGDELRVTLRGQRSTTRRYRIDSQGLLLIDGLDPIPAGGRRLGDVREEIGATVRDVMPGTRSFVSVAAVRRIGVLIVGDVGRPGLHWLSAFATVTDAVFAAGGIRRTGTLRHITLGRRDGSEVLIDLYRYLIGGGTAPSPRLRDGDRLRVPPIGAVVGIGGAVKRPGLYELSSLAPLPDLAEVLGWAGGGLLPGPVRAVRLAVGSDGEQVSDLLRSSDQLGDGDIVLIRPRSELRAGQVVLDGYVRRPGPRAKPGGSSLRSLLVAEALERDVHRPFAVLFPARWPIAGAEPSVFDVDRVLSGAEDLPVSDGDTIALLGPDHVDFLNSAAVLAALRDEPNPPGAEACDGISLLRRSLRANLDGPLARSPAVTAAARLVGPLVPCPPLYDRLPDTLLLAVRYAVLVRDGPGRLGLIPFAHRSDSGEVMAGREPWIELDGHVRNPGVLPLHQVPSLVRALDGGRRAESGAYPWFAVVERFDEGSLARRLLPFAPSAVLGGRFDRRLQDRDRVILFSTETVRTALRDQGSRPASGDEIGGNGGGLEVEAPIDGDFERALLEATGLLDSEMVGVMADYAVHVQGAVRSPGRYPLAGTAPIRRFLETTANLLRTADLGQIEVTPSGRRADRRLVRLAAHTAVRVAPIRPGDTIRVQPRVETRQAGDVVVRGEILRPGRYGLVRGETLSVLLRRAGGLTPDAYPAGAVFLRESARRGERQRFLAVARQLERSVALDRVQPDKFQEQDAAVALDLAAELSAAVPLGRITVEADPAVLRARPELDILLEPGDELFVPKRPLTVAVAGEVLSPASLQFVTGKRADDYLREAGGFTRYADEGRRFVLLPDGSAQPLGGSAWRHRPDPIPPGSTIVVPRDPEPFDWLETSTSIGSILSQLAVTAASLSVIGRE